MNTAKEFDLSLDSLLKRIWMLQIRFSELHEFEKQWKQLYDELNRRTGKDCFIRILGQSAYRSYRWDKYHVLISDLCSLLENELDQQNVKSVINATDRFIKIHTHEEYEKKCEQIFFKPTGKPEDDAKSEMAMRKIFGVRVYEKSAESLKYLYPKIDKDLIVRGVDKKHLLSKVNSLLKRIKDLRHYFNHKYEDVTTARYQGSLKDFDIKNFESLISDIFSIVTKIGYLFKLSVFDDAGVRHETEVSDQVDIILFGSIENAMGLFYSVSDESEFYWQARAKFYSSEEIIKFVVRN